MEVRPAQEPLRGDNHSSIGSKALLLRLLYHIRTGFSIETVQMRQWKSVVFVCFDIKNDLYSCGGNRIMKAARQSKG